MAVVGSAELVVTAVTTGFKKQIQEAFREARPVAATEGERYGKAFGGKFKTQFKKSIRDSFSETRKRNALEGERYGKAFGGKFKTQFTKAIRDAFSETRTGAAEEGERQGALFGESFAKGFGDAIGDTLSVRFKDAADDYVRAVDEASRALANMPVPQAAAPGAPPASAGPGGGAPVDDAEKRLNDRKAADDQAHAARMQRIEDAALAAAQKLADQYDKIDADRAAADAKRNTAALDTIQRLSDQYDKVDANRAAADAKRNSAALDAIQKISDQYDKIDADRAAADSKRDAAARDRAQKLADDLQAINDKAAARRAAADQKAADDAVRRAQAAAQRMQLSDDAFQARQARQRRARQDREGGGGGSGIFSDIVRGAEAANRSFTMLYGIGNMVATGLTGLIGAVVALGAALISLSAAASVAAGSLVVLPALLGAAVQGAVTGITAFRGVGAAISAGFKAAGGSAARGGKAGVNAARAVEDARKALARAYEDAARRMRDADQRVLESQERLAESQNEARIAQEALTGARERAAERLQQLAFDVEGAALSEESAVLRLQRATEELAKVTANPASTAQEIQEASLNYREAELALRRAQDAYEDIQKEQEAAAAAGVEGSYEVVSAQNAIIEAANAVVEAQRGLRDAEEARADAAVQSSRAIADAQERLNEALQDQGSAMGGAAAAADAYQEALAKLSPDARRFVEYIVSLKDELATLKAAAGEQLFAGLTTSVQRIVENFFPALEQMLRVTGGSLAKFADSISMVVSSAGFISRFTAVAEDNADVIARFGDIVASVIDGISGVMVAAGPITSQFTDYLVRQADTFQRYATSGAGMSEMTAYFQDAADTAGQLGRIFGNLWEGLLNIGSAARPAGDALLDTIEQATDKWAAFTGSFSRQNELEEYFSQANANAVAVLQLLKDIGDVFGGLGDNPQIAQAANLLRREFVPSLEKIMEAAGGGIYAFAELTASVAKFFEGFADSGVVTLFFSTLTAVVDTLTGIFQSDLAQAILAIVAPIAAVTKAFGLIWLPIKFFTSSLVGAVTTWQSLVTAVGGGTGRILSNLATITTGFFILREQMIQSAIQAGVSSGIIASTFGTLGAAFSAGLTGIRALGRGLLALVGGPAGAAMLAITVLVGVFTHFKQKAEEAKQATQDFADSLDEASGAVTAKSFELFADTVSDKLVGSLEEAGIGMDEFMGMIADGKPGMDALRDRLEAAGYSTARVDALMQMAAGTQRSWNSTVEGATDVWEKDKRNKEASAKAADAYRKQTVLARAATMDQNEIMASQNALMEKLAKNYRDAVADFTYLNDTAINQQETAIRAAEALDELTGSVQEAREALGLKQEMDISSAVVTENNTKKLNLQSEAGRAVMESTIDYMKAIDDQMQANLDAGMSIDEANAKYEAQKQAFIDAAESAGISREAVEGYITTIEKTPSERKTRFLAILEEQSIQQLTENMDYASRNRVALYLSEIDNPTMAQVVEAVEEVTKDKVVTYLSETDRQAYEEAKAKIFSLTVDENGNPIDVSLLADADKAALAEAERKIAELTNKARTAPVKVVLSADPKVIMWDEGAQGGKLVPVGAIRMAAAGGPVIGPGGPKDDRAGLFALSHGEYVLSARAVKALGGTAAVDAVHRAAGGGGSSRRLMADGGPVTADVLRSLSALSGGGTGGGSQRSSGMTAGERAMLAQLERMERGGMTVSIGTITAPEPVAAAREVVSAMRSEAYLLGRYA
jgi:hypothetical protein